MQKQGFTLLEMLVVVLIIGILSAVALPNYRKAIERTKTAEAVVLSKNILDAAMIYSQVYRRCPDSLADLDIKVNEQGKYWDFGVGIYGPSSNRNCFVKIASRDTGLNLERAFVSTPNGADQPKKGMDKGTIYWRCAAQNQQCTDFFTAIKAKAFTDNGTEKFYQ